MGPMYILPCHRSMLALTRKSLSAMERGSLMVMRTAGSEIVREAVLQQKESKIESRIGLSCCCSNVSCDSQ